jgi:hypothetical protein
MPVMHLTAIYVMPVMHLTAISVMPVMLLYVCDALPALFKKCQRKKLLAVTCMPVMSIAGTFEDLPRKQLEAYR